MTLPTPPITRRAEIPELPKLEPPPGWKGEMRWDGTLILTSPDGLVVKGTDTKFQGRRVRSMVVVRDPSRFPSATDIDTARAAFFGGVIVAVEFGILPGGKPLLTLAHSPDWTPEHAARVDAKSQIAMRKFRAAETIADDPGPVLPTPKGWEKRPNPLTGRPLYTQGKLRVIVTDEELGGRRRRMASISLSNRRLPKPKEVELVAELFLGDEACEGRVDLKVTPVEGMPVDLVYLLRDLRETKPKVRN